MDGQERSDQRERLHPAAGGTLLLMLVSVGRLPELLPALGVLQLGNVAVVLGVLGLLIARWRDDVPVLATSTGRLLAVFTVLAFVSVPISVWRGGSLEVLLGALAPNLVLFFLIARSANSPRMLRIYAAGLTAAAAMLALEAVVGYTAGRVEVGQAYDANDLAMVLVTIIPFVVGGILASGGLRRLVMMGIAVTMLLTVLLTGSRGGILGLIAVTTFLLFARFPRLGVWRQPRRFGFGKILFVALGGVVLVAAMPQFTLDRMASLADYQSDYNVTAEDGRLAIWSRGISAMAERPWGHGIGTFEDVEMREGGRFKAAHNIWIEIGVELGLPGLLVLFGLFWTGVRTSTRLAERAFIELDTVGRDAPSHAATLATLAVALKGALLGFFVTSMFLSVAFTGVLYVLLALCAALEYQERALVSGREVQGTRSTRNRRRERRRPAYDAASFADSRGGPHRRSSHR